MKIMRVFCLAVGMVSMISCSKVGLSDKKPDEPIEVPDPIMVMSPVPTEEIGSVSLDESQKGYAEAGSRMAFRFLGQLYEGENIICSPLSLQYALAMAANGASGQTRQEMIDFLGYGKEGIDVLNDYSKTLMEQLPAVDLDVTLKVTDALVVNDSYPLLASFKRTAEDHYYAAVESMDFSDPEYIAARINEWAARNTDGFVDKVLDEEEISSDAVAFIMNALYFKAKWAGDEYDPMFDDAYTRPEDFHLSDGQTVKVDMMRNMRWHRYAEMDGYKVLELPYANGRFNMYVLLPDENDIDDLVEKLQTTSWTDVAGNMKKDAEVYVRLPKFEMEEKYDLSDVLKALGVKKAFQSGMAEFDVMFDPHSGDVYSIDKVIQKSRIAVSEWGTEAGSVTVIGMEATAPEPGGEEPKKVYFHVDRPFVFVIGEETSGTILFEGVCMHP